MQGRERDEIPSRSSALEGQGPARGEAQGGWQTQGTGNRRDPATNSTRCHVAAGADRPQEELDTERVSWYDVEGYTH